MTAFESIVDYMRAIPKPDIDRANFMAAQVLSIPGWSGPLQYLFFEAAIRCLPENPSVLMCGVYHGRDLLLLSMASKFLKSPVRLAGVDLFSNQPCADWTEAQKKIGCWELSDFGMPPNMETAQYNCPEATITKGNSIDYLLSGPECGGKFDLIYLDTSHDHQTVQEEIAAAIPRLNPGGLLAGDDYIGEPHWGVKQAVDEAFSSRAVFGNQIWLAQP